MTIDKAIDNDDMLEEEAMMDEDSSYTFRQLMDLLLEKKEVIVTVPSSQVNILRKGLSMRKNKDNRIAEAKGLLKNEEVLSFTSYPAMDSDMRLIANQSSVRIKLAPKKSVTILNVVVPDDSF